MPSKVWFAAETRGLPRLLKAGDSFVSKVDKTIGTGPSYWVRGESIVIPRGSVGEVRYGDPHSVGRVCIKRV
jgi:hypothetical protein